jgi:hypothetical protein
MLRVLKRDSKWLLTAGHLEEGRQLENKLKALLQQVCGTVDNQIDSFKLTALVRQ